MTREQYLRFQKTLIIPAVVELLILLITTGFICYPSILDALRLALVLVLPAGLLYLASVQLLWSSEPILTVLLFGFRLLFFCIDWVFPRLPSTRSLRILSKLALCIPALLISFLLTPFCLLGCLLISPFTFRASLRYIKQNPDQIWL